ncbi:unnamed protein product [Diatraea saccharalis]|uniref:Uncharacterized protein n=1 Tax=Diatraea saccharalis TaxID=40085 RepID=A0A9N9WCY4_9NEOP|nr:unnamed protein product [Diatraea saccharalis]
MSIDTGTNDDRCVAVLLKVIPITVPGPKGNANTYALLDEGATVSLIEENLAQKLAKGTSRPPSIRGVAASHRVNSVIIEVTIANKSFGNAYLVKLRTIRQLALDSRLVPVSVLYPHLRGLDARVKIGSKMR